MSYELHQDKHQHSGPLAATALIPRTPVKFAGTNVLLVSPVATAADRPDGVTNVATYTASEVVTVYFSQNVVKMRCNASLAAGADVFVASVNGGVGASGIIAASQHWIIGQALTTASAGEIVSVFINPRRA